MPDELTMLKGVIATLFWLLVNNYRGQSAEAKQSLEDAGKIYKIGLEIALKRGDEWRRYALQLRATPPDDRDSS